MRQHKSFQLIFGLCAVLFWGRGAVVVAETVRDMAYEVQTTILQNPLRVQINWKPAVTSVYNLAEFTLSKRPWVENQPNPSNAAPFAPITGLSLDATTYTDSSIVVGQPVEYQLSRYLKQKADPKKTYLNVTRFVVGIDVPWDEQRGGALLVVDETVNAPLATELTQFERDLNLDGYTVTRVTTPRMVVDPSVLGSAIGPRRRAEIDSVRDKISAWYQTNPPLNRTVILVGRVPVPYTGTFAHDGHGNHFGAWSGDAYYADIVSSGATLPVWGDVATQEYWFASTDRLLNPRNQNIPGDGKLDNSRTPTVPELQVGRIDFAGVTHAPEITLLKRYFARDHAYRIRTGAYAQIGRRVLIDDNFGTAVNYYFSRVAWDAAPTLFGPNTAFEGTWFAQPLTSPTFIGYASGSGSYSGMLGVGTSDDFGVKPSTSPFTMVFGSYFGDWDYPLGRLMQTIVAGSENSLALTTIVGSWVEVDPSPLAVGASYGVLSRRKAEVSTNNTLLGDPSLRLQYFAPPQNVTAVRKSNGVTLAWSASPSAGVIGYHVLRAPTVAGPYTRITGVPVTIAAPHGNAIAATTFIDTSVTGAANPVYAVEAVGKVTSGTASYYDNSQATPVTVSSVVTPKAPTNIVITEE